MKYFNIDCWQDCLTALDNYDVCGVNWHDWPSVHFSGNYW